MLRGRATRTAAAAAALAGALLTACADGIFHPPAAAGPAQMDLSYTLAGSEDGSEAAFAKADAVWVRITGGSVAVDTVLPFSPAGEARLRVAVENADPQQVYQLRVELRHDGSPLFRAVQETRIEPGRVNPATVTLQPFAASMTFCCVPDSVSLRGIGDTLRVEVAAFFSTGDTLPGWPRLSSSNPAVAVVDSTGLIRSTGVGTAEIRFELPPDPFHTGGALPPIPVRVADPCATAPLGTGVTSGELKPSDCLFPVSGRRSHYYTLTVPAGEMLLVDGTATFDGIFGVKEVTADPTSGTVWGSNNFGQTLRIVSNGEPLQLYVSGQDSTQFGQYMLHRSSAAPWFECGTWNFLMPGSSVTENLDPADSCIGSITVTPDTANLGDPILTEGWNAKLQAGVSYTASVTYSGQPHPALTILGAEGVVAQEFPGANGGSMSATFTIPVTGYYYIEFSTGQNSDGSWPATTYTLSLSR